MYMYQELYSDVHACDFYQRRVILEDDMHIRETVIICTGKIRDAGMP